MAYVTAFTIFGPDGNPIQVSIPDLATDYEFTGGAYGTGDVYTMTAKYLASVRGTNLIQLIRDKWASTLAGATTNDQRFTINIVGSDGGIDPNRGITVYYRKITIPKPFHFGEWADTDFRLSEGTITVPGTAFKILPFGEEQVFIQLYFYAGNGNAVIMTSHLNGIPVRYKYEASYSSGYSSDSNCYWPIQELSACVITQKERNGDRYYQVVAGVLPNLNASMFPGYARRVDAYRYVWNGIYPEPGKTVDRSFLWLRGNSAYGLNTIPPIALGQMYISGGTGGSGGGPSTPGGGETGTIPDSGTGETGTGNMQGTNPGLSGDGLVDVGPEGDYSDTFGGGLASLGGTISGGYLVVSMTMGELATFFDRLFDTNPIEGFIDYIKNYFGSVKDAIIAANIFPFNVPGSSRNIQIGGWTTGTGNVITSQFVTIDMGSVEIKPYWDNFLDWNNTTVSIYVPYVGWQQLQTTDVMGRTISLRYNVDLVTGQFAAILKVKSETMDCDMYQWSGSMAMSIPITSSSTFDPSIISSLFAIGGGLVSAGAVTAAGGMEHIATQTLTTKAGGDVISKSQTIDRDIVGQPPNAGTSIGSALGSPAGSISRGGGATGSAGMLGPLVPAVIIDRPIQAVPDNYGDLCGYPSELYSTFSDLKGYTEVQTWAPSFTGLSSAEIAELDRIVKGGFYL